MKSYSLLQLTQSIESVISKTYNKPYWVRAEILKLNFYPHSGHCYPELVEKANGKIVAEIRSTIWRNVYQSITAKFKKETGEDLREGMTVLFQINVTYNPKYGISLKVLDIDPSFSLGEMAKEKNQSIETLKREGIFTKNRSLPFPYFPHRLAIISVETSKGYHDFIQTIRTKASQFNIQMQLFPALLQGDAAVESMMQQLEIIRNRMEDFDLVLIIRGGGGDVGLHCYNHVQLARTVATYPIPVISGIGHSTNETVVEMVANSNKITPTAVADMLVERYRELENNLNDCYRLVLNVPDMFLTPHKQKLHQWIRLLKSAASEPIHTEKMKLQRKGSEIQRAVEVRFSKERSNLDLKIWNEIKMWSTRKIEKRKTHIAHIAEKIAILDPKNTLKRGFSMSLVNGKIISDISQVTKGQILETVLYDGKIESEITKKITHE